MQNLKHLVSTSEKSMEGGNINEDELMELMFA